MEFLTLPAQARYRVLLEQSPELPERVKQKDIARYLGITPVALSRTPMCSREGGEFPS